MSVRSKQSIDDQVREAAEASLINFIKLVHPEMALGTVHERLCSWWDRPGHKSHQLCLIPREHLKSTMIAFRVAWYLTKYPWMRFYYVSSTSNLAEKQLSFIKQILTSDRYRKYWPEMVNPEESKRTQWTVKEITVDHPERKKRHVRDPSIFIGGLTTERTGMHCDIAVLDDLVTVDNAYTEEGRTKVESQYSLLSSIETTNAQEWVVGTIYSQQDLYTQMIDLKVEEVDEDGNLVGSTPLYEVFLGQVEDKGDGSGVFLWPRTKTSSGEWYGFNREILAKKKAQYIDRLKFRAQYYNDPNDPEHLRVDRSKFQYYDRKYLQKTMGTWYYKETRLNLFAAIDFAYTIKKRSDWTSIVVVGVDPSNNIYVLDIDRFKTDKISEYYEHILDMHTRWGFRKLSAEVTAAQSVIVKELKEHYFKVNGISMSIHETRPTRHEGNKEERISAILEPKYDNMQMWHYEGGYCTYLEDEIMLEKPPHDDIKDALANAVAIAVAPQANRARDSVQNRTPLVYHSRFGGVRA